MNLPPLKERDPILAVCKEHGTSGVRRAFVTRQSLDTVHFVVGSTEKWLHLAHEGIMWIRGHQHTKERKAALLASGILLGDEAWAARVVSGTDAEVMLEPGVIVAQGDVLYASHQHPGRVTNAKPVAAPIKIGIALNSCSGSVFCRITP